jgi:hypothetical protein
MRVLPEAFLEDVDGEALLDEDALSEAEDSHAFGQSR